LNVLEIRELYGMSQQEFASRIGYSRELVNKVEKGRMKPSRWLAEAVRQFISTHPLMQNSQEVKKSDRGTSTFSFLESRRQQKSAATMPTIPLVGIKAQAGYMSGFEHADYIDTLEQYSVPPGVNTAGATWRYFEIDGDSMEPSLHPGDMVLATMVPVEDWNELRKDAVYIIHMTDRLMIKRARIISNTQWELISDNELYPPQKISVEDVKQLWLLRRHIRSKVPLPV
jgi:phage repressor protein C with HTH and peptisase S24 domain